METANIVIIGAGVVGLAVAAELSEKNENVFLLEKNSRFGQETSSHNSGVIHSGIHYPPGSLKAKLCVEANTMLYKLCEEQHIPYKKLGKITVAITEEEIGELEKLRRWGEANGVTDLEFLDKEQVKKLEPTLEVERALYSPSTGIIEPDELMNHFHAKARNNQVSLATETEVTAIRKIGNKFEIVGTSVGQEFMITANCVVNCGGLHADRVAAMIGLDVDKLGYRIHYCKGDYFRLVGKPPVRMLVYPVPRAAGLGIHLTPDLAGTVKLGPNDYYVNEINYEVKSDEKEFRKDVERFMPLIHDRELQADMSGVRPKLQGPGDPFRDFIIHHEADHGMPGLISLIGIESPGLTAAPVIAKHVANMYENEVRRWIAVSR
jgi:L-2-hydroxyglutarate oxidase LhgO